MSQQWSTKSLRLKGRHGWKARPGFAICAIDRGAIRLDYPAGWHVSPSSDSLKIRDFPEPDDNCVLAVSQMHLPREIADQVPIRELVEASSQHDDRQIFERGEVIEVPREDGVELAHTESLYLDPKENRRAFSRLAIGRGSGVYCLITFDFWTEDAAKCAPVWDEVLRSLTLGLYIKDPAVGPVVH